jgi:uncharacterized protein
MKVLLFSDIHSDLAALQRLMDTEADMYFAAGDLVSWARGLDKIGPILQKKNGRVWVLPGNHEHATQIEAFTAQYGLKSLHEKLFERDGWHFAGLGHSSPTPFDTPGEYTEADFEERLKPFAGKHPLVLVCHSPPLNTTLDESAQGQHYGCQAIRDFIEREQPEWFFCGHIHEAAGREEKIGRTRCINLGKEGFLLKLDKL